MQLTLSAFRALMLTKAGDVLAIAGPDGFTVQIAGGTLYSDVGNVRVFKNLTTLARFAKTEGASEMRVNLGQISRRRRVAAKPKAKPKAKATAKAA